MEVFSLSDRALARVSQEGQGPAVGAVEAPAVSPFKVAMREAYDAVKSDNFDGFAEAFQNALEIRLAEPRE